MNSGEIFFPHLGIYLHNVPKGITIGNFTIAFYGMLIGMSVLIGLYVAIWNAKRTDAGKADLYWDVTMWGVVIGIICARLFYVACSWDYYKDDLLSIFNFRGGGLAIYGGVLGAFATIAVFCKIKKMNTFLLGDNIMPSILLGQSIGRWGNFFNREVFGEYTDNLFAMQLPIADIRARDITESLAQHIADGQNYVQVHPTFLYESLFNFALFLFFLFYLTRKKFNGEIWILYLGGYGLIRFILENIRTDTLFLPGTTIKVNALIAAIMVVVAVVLEITCRILVRKGKIPTYSRQAE